MEIIFLWIRQTWIAKQLRIFMAKQVLYLT